MDDFTYMQRVRSMEQRLYRISRAILWRDADCADAVQEAVFRGWMKKTALRDERYFETWLIRILINECKSILRRRKRESLFAVGSDDFTEPSREDTLCENLQLRDALKALPKKYRLPLLLHSMEGYSYDEISVMLALPKPLIRSRLHQARGRLRELYEGGDRT